jgi:hypothetical protein
MGLSLVTSQNFLPLWLPSSREPETFPPFRILSISAQNKQKVRVSTKISSTGQSSVGLTSIFIKNFRIHPAEIDEQWPPECGSMMEFLLWQVAPVERICGWREACCSGGV